MKIHFAKILALLFLFSSCGTGASGDGWTAALVVSETDSVTVAGTEYGSSSQLALAWTAPSAAVDHYRITATEATGSTSVTATADGSAASATLTGLKSATAYAVDLEACLDEECEETLSPSEGSGSGTTQEEVWQLQGSGDSIAELTKVVSDGNAKISALFYGEGAGAGLEGKIQLYYGPSGASRGLAVGTQATAGVDDVATVISFTSQAGASGLVNPSAATSLIQEVNTGHAVPLSAALGGRIRLYFEATGSDGKTRILSLDSQDGYAGLDFNAATDAAVCNTTAHYSGGCLPTVEIGVEGDSVQGNAGLSHARQFKIGFPTLDDWRWDGSAGTFMIFTANTNNGCSSAAMTQAYAVWDGAAWDVQYVSGSCPKLFENMQAPAPLHLGGARYKLYFGDPSDTTGKNDSSPLPFLGPKKVTYADGGSTGEAGIVDFEDWESETDGRGMTFLWPSGAPMDATDEGYIDDFMMLTPTQDLDFQVMYMAITDGTVPPISAAAHLLNP